MTCLHREPPCDCGDHGCPECGFPDPTATFDNIPDDWRVAWCPVCGYAVTFDDATWNTYDQAEWPSVLGGAARHDHGGCPGD